jgi:hypothetical protein
MFEKFIIVPGSVRNVKRDGEVVGFAFDTRITYYRGMGVSMVEPFEIRVDGGEVIPADQLTFTINDRTWTFAELENDYESRWELTQPATVTAFVPGGLTPGAHEFDITEVLRVSYQPTTARRRLVKTVDVS